VVGLPSTIPTYDSNYILKRYALNLTNNNNPSAQYLSLTPYIAQFSVIDTITIAFWFKATSQAPNVRSTLINFLNTTNNKNISINLIQATQQLELNVNSDTLTTLTCNSTAAYLDGAWHHIAIILGTGGNQIYVDNVRLLSGSTLIYTSGGNGVPTPDFATNTLKDLTFQRITIGGQFNGVSLSNPFMGYLYNIYMTQSRLTSTEISALYNENTINTYAIKTCSMDTTELIASTVKYKYIISSSSALNLSNMNSNGTNYGHYYTLSSNIVVITLPTGTNHSGRTFTFYWTGSTSIQFLCTGVDTISNIGASYIYTGPTNITFRITYNGLSNWIFI
jgi:hypothetical protein